MTIPIRRILIASCLAFWPLLAPQVRAGDPAAGSDQSIPCLACHGADGTSDHHLWPSIAGQSQGYLVKQMRDFRDGSRQDPWMSPIAAGLGDAEIENLADYFGSLPGLTAAGNAPPEKARNCIGCHSVSMTAANPLWPRLGGLHQRYLVKQLQDYRAGRRADPIMAPLAKALSDQDIEELAAYFAAQGGHRGQ